MQQDDRIDHLSELERRCRERGVPLTSQRRIVYEALLDSTEHPSAERLYDTVRRTLPGISPATVYRVLEFLVDLGVARKTSHPGSQARFDAKVLRHHHLVCQVCERIVDLEDATLNDLPIPDRRRTGFELTDYSIHFRGTCPDCLKKRKPSR